MMIQNPIRRSNPSVREGKVLMGCLIALAVVVVLAIAATVLIVLNFSKMLSWGFEKGADAIVAQLPIDETEREEVMGELSGLIDRYRNKEISVQEFGKHLEAIADTPAVQAGLLSSAASSYINGTPLSEEEKASGEIELRRLALGILEGSVNPDALEEILTPLEASDRPDTETITLGVHINSAGKDEFKILKPSAVTKEQITRVIEAARAKADEAEIEATPAEIDLSEEIRKAIERTGGDITIPDEAP